MIITFLIYFEYIFIYMKYKNKILNYNCNNLILLIDHFFILTLGGIV